MMKARTATAITAGTNRAETMSARRWIGARTLRLRHHLHDLRQHGVAADFFCFDHEGAGLVDGAANDAGAGFFRHRH
jgi:hypothetical protein